MREQCSRICTLTYSSVHAWVSQQTQYNLTMSRIWERNSKIGTRQSAVVRPWCTTSPSTKCYISRLHSAVWKEGRRNEGFCLRQFLYVESKIVVPSFPPTAPTLWARNGMPEPGLFLIFFFFCDILFHPCYNNDSSFKKYQTEIWSL